MLRPELKYGLIAGLGVSLWFYAEYFLGLHTTRPDLGKITGQLSSLVLIFTLWSMLRRQQRALGPAFRLPVSLLAGIQASLVAATLIYISTTFYRHYVNPDWFVDYLNAKVTELRAAGTAETSIQLYAENARRYSTPGYLLLGTLLIWTMQGTLFTVFLTLGLRWQFREKAQ
jgi:hypothetical protein